MSAVVFARPFECVPFTRWSDDRWSFKHLTKLTIHIVTQGGRAAAKTCVALGSSKLGSSDVLVCHTSNACVHCRQPESLIGIVVSLALSGHSCSMARDSSGTEYAANLIINEPATPLPRSASSASSAAIPPPLPPPGRFNKWNNVYWTRTELQTAYVFYRISQRFPLLKVPDVTKALAKSLRPSWTLPIVQPCR